MRTLNFSLFTVFLLAITIQSTAQIALQSGKYVLKNPANEYGLFYSTSQSLDFKDNDGVTRLIINPNNNYSMVCLRSIVAVKGGTLQDASQFGVIGYTYGAKINYGLIGLARVDTSGSAAVYANGDAVVIGNLYFPSDRRLKNNLQPMERALPDLMRLEPMTYTYKSQGENSPLPLGEQMGFIAQDVKKVFPELIRKKYLATMDKDGKVNETQTEFEGINYIGLIPVLVKGIQQQQSLIEDQQARLDDLEDRLWQLEYSQPVSAAQPRQDIYLSPNYPNPFSSLTAVDYELPYDVENAELVLFDQSGRILQRKALNSGSRESIQLDLSGLAAGTYVVSVLVDGDLVKSRQMIHF